MRKWKIRSKCLLALILVMILGMQLFQGTRVIEVQATAINAGFSTEGKVTNGDFESGRVGYTVKGWSMTSMNASSEKNSDKDWTPNFALKTESDGGSRVASFSKNSTGYAAMTSQQVAVVGGKTYELSVDYKMKDFSLDIDPKTGEAYTSDITFRGIRFVVEQLDADGNKIQYTKYPDSNIKEEESVTWKNYSTEFTTAEDTKSVVVHCWLGGDKYVNSTVLLDNVTIEASEDNLSDWTMECCKYNGVPRDGTFTNNFGIREISDGVEHKKALQLYITREAGILGGVVIYSAPVQIQDDKEYTTSYDLKIQNYNAEEDSNNIFGAQIVLRYLDNQGKRINGDAPQVCRNGKENINWTYYEHTFTPPEGAVSVQFGLVMGSTKLNICKDMTYTIDNIVILEKEAHKEYKKDPAVTSSSLYKQSALFVGDVVGGGLAQQASSYSEMQVTDACSDTVTLAEQLKMYAENTYDYLFVSGGMQEFASNMPAGRVTADTVYMDGMDFDTTTFAGMMEYNFGKIAEYYGQQKVVYVLTTDNTEYQTVAQSAANKWNVQLVMLGDVSNAVVNWNEIIEPAEAANVFDCYQVPKLLDYLSKRVDEIVGTKISITVDVAALENIKEKAQNCPDTHVDYEGYQTLILRIEDTLVKFQDFRPLICGGTISTEDPNVLSFIALSPKNALTEGIKIKAMGILSMPTAYMDQTSSEYKPDAVLELDNAYVKNMEAVYSEAAKEFRVYQESWEVDPYTEYTARAYVVYEANEQTLVFYSTNDYVNELGIKTAENGCCTKSVFGISKTVALKLASEKAQEMSFASIGGEENMSLIDMAAEDTEISLLDVYHLIHENRTLMKEWLDKGGTSE